MSGWQDLNLRPHGSEPCVLAKLNYTQMTALLLATSRDDWIRTSDLAHPKRALFSRLSYIPMKWRPVRELNPP